MNNATRQKIRIIKKLVIPIFKNPIKYLYFLFINAFCKVQYVIVDCEFNDNSIEIIQMGLVKMTSEMEVVDSLNIFIRPISPNAIEGRREGRREILEQSNKSDVSFPEAIKMINKWIGNDCKTILCVWGISDISAINKNSIMHNLSKSSLSYTFCFNIQKVFLKKRKNKFDYVPSLKIALEKEKIKVTEPLHNAFADARLTASLFKNIYSKYTAHIAQFLVWQ